LTILVILLYTRIMKEPSTRWWDYPAIVCFSLAMAASVFRLETTNWTSNLNRLLGIVLIGILLGTVLGKSRFNGWISFVFGLVFSLTIVPWELASLMYGSNWLERSMNLFGRLNASITALVSNRPVQDPILFLSSMVFLYWFCSLIGGYRLIRFQRPWASLLVAGLMVLIVDYSFEMYASPDSGTSLSLVFFLSVVVLVAREYFLHSRDQWKQSSHTVENMVGYDLGRGAFLAALVLVLLAWFTPRAVKSFTAGTPEQRALATQFQELRDRVSKAVSSLRSQGPLIADSLGETLALGNSTHLGDSVVFTAKPGGGQLSNGRFYWNGRVYDTYDNGVWETKNQQASNFGGSQAPVAYNWDDRFGVSVTIASQSAVMSTLFYPGAPTSVNRPVVAMENQSSDDNPEITALISQSAVQAGESYVAEAQMSITTITNLNGSAILVYPKAITDQYLELPQNFSPKIAQLARDITLNAHTPYEKTVAVTDWLRTNMTYQASLPEKPASVDPIEWFLFDIKAGFCNYYASSEVLMLRSLGIPARMVAGYAQGDWHKDDGTFYILARDYHAWPEVFFPKIGWIPFEPTASQPDLVYPVGGVNTDTGPVVIAATPTYIPQNAGGGDTLEPKRASRGYLGLDQDSLTNLYKIAAIVLAVALLVFAYFWWRKHSLKDQPFATWTEKFLIKRGMKPPKWLSIWSVRAQRTKMEVLFAYVGEILRIWGKPPTLDLTPSEQVEALSQLAPELSGVAGVLLDEYLRAAYSKHLVDFYRARQAAVELRQKGYQIWVQNLLHIKV
jgi:transglutaminase-like putative cysteine protease